MKGRFLFSDEQIVSEVGNLYRVREQGITQRFLDNCQAERSDKGNSRSGDWEKVASVPTVVIDKWLAQGIPFYELSPHEILMRLSAENLGAFITTNKRI